MPQYSIVTVPVIPCLFLSIMISIILYNYKILYKILDPYLTMLNSLPKVALGPIIIIFFGANTKSIIIVSILISIIVSIQTIYVSFINTDKLKIKLLNTFNASKKDILYNLVLPSNKSTIINTFKDRGTQDPHFVNPMYLKLTEAEENKNKGN